MNINHLKVVSKSYNTYNYLYQIMKSYKEFKKKKISLENNKLINAVFCVENYKVSKYKDKDQLK